MFSKPTSAAPTFKVLVVEDEFTIAMDLRRILRSANYEVVGPVGTVASALVLIRKQLPDACILDYGLRSETSEPIAEVLRDKNVPFLLSSAYKTEMIEWQQAFKGILNIGKPVQDDELLSALGSILQSKH
jgi:DNA-binding response OmpR family regulator